MKSRGLRVRAMWERGRKRISELSSSLSRSELSELSEFPPLFARLSAAGSEWDKFFPWILRVPHHIKGRIVFLLAYSVISANACLATRVVPWIGRRCVPPVMDSWWTLLSVRLPTTTSRADKREISNRTAKFSLLFGERRFVIVKVKSSLTRVAVGV